jgi:hypothetical protein
MGSRNCSQKRIPHDVVLAYVLLLLVSVCASGHSICPSLRNHHRSFRRFKAWKMRFLPRFLACDDAGLLETAAEEEEEEDADEEEGSDDDDDGFSDEGTETGGGASMSRSSRVWSLRQEQAWRLEKKADETPESTHRAALEAILLLPLLLPPPPPPPPPLPSPSSPFLGSGEIPASSARL